MGVITLTKDNFDQVVNEHDLMVIDFTADWCEPCQAFSEAYKTVAQEIVHATFGQINVGQEPELANDFNVRSVPMIMILRYQVAIFMQSGAITSTELKRLIDEATHLTQEDIRAYIDQSLNDTV